MVLVDKNSSKVKTARKKYTSDLFTREFLVCDFLVAISTAAGPTYQLQPVILDTFLIRGVQS